VRPPAETFQDIHFPKAGVHAAGPYGRQPTRPGRDGVYVRTYAGGANVRSYDAASGRDRGGSRAGLSKYIPARVGTDGYLGLSDVWVVQALQRFVVTDASVPAVQQSPSGRVVYLVAVSQGQVKWAQPDDDAWTATTNSTGETPPLNVAGPVYSAANNQKLYFVDGTNYVYFNPPTNELLLWTATAGTLPEDADGNRARLICTWRGRTVLSGLLKDPQNYFMSRPSDPHDFDYFPANVTADVPVAGNNSEGLGLIGDVVTALIPYTDDVLVFGGDHTIFAMRGDPAAGGSVDLVSDITGIAFGQAWCKDPYGTIYFFGGKPSVWRMGGNLRPERISDPIEPLIRDVNTGENVITLVWNDETQSVHLFITPDAAPGDATHYTWESRANAWHPDTFANDDHNPLCVCSFDGNDADDRVVLTGGWDGYVRYLDRTATTDDGTAIASYVLLGPILTQEFDEMLLKDLQFLLAETSGEVSWSILAADTAEAAVAAAARASGTAAAGRNPTQPIRVADHAIYVKISATTRWAMEAVKCRFAGRGKVRRRKP
jgi:hypothetical protein